jgi:hypothetical protein
LTISSLVAVVAVVDMLRVAVLAALEQVRSQ